MSATTSAAPVPMAFAVGGVALAVYLFAHAGMIVADMATSVRPAPAPALAAAGSAPSPLVHGTPTVATTTGAGRASGLRVRQACQALMSVAMGWMLLGML